MALTERARPLGDDDGTILMLPLDHGISMGPMPGLVPMQPLVDAVAGVATCITVHKGFVPRLRRFHDRTSIMMHLSASTDRAADPHDKRIVGTVEEAMDLGAVGVTTHLNLGSRTEADQIEAIGRVGTACNRHDVPHIMMVYPRGPKIKHPHDPVLVAHAARLAAELGADAVKVPYTGDVESFAGVVKGARIPVIVAGGPRQENFDDFLASVQGAREAGASGVSVGRNVFQHPDPRKAMTQIRDVFRA